MLRRDPRSRRGCDIPHRRSLDIPRVFLVSPRVPGQQSASGSVSQRVRGADLYRDAATVSHADLPSQMYVNNWPYPASAYLDLYGTVNVYLGGHYGSAASNIWYNLAQATASQQIIFSVVMY